MLHPPPLDEDLKLKLHIRIRAMVCACAGLKAALFQWQCAVVRGGALRAV